MERRTLWVAALAALVALALAAAPAAAMGKKAPVEKEKELGQAGTMTKSYDPETGVKSMEKTTGHGEKEMVMEKEPHSGVQMERSWKTGPPAERGAQGKGHGK